LQSTNGSLNGLNNESNNGLRIRYLSFNLDNRRLDVFGASVISWRHRVLCYLGFTFHYFMRRRDVIVLLGSVPKPEDEALLLVQKKLSNLERDVTFDLNVVLRMFTRRVVILNRVEDLQLRVKTYHKKLNIIKPKTFSLRMDYLPKREKAIKYIVGLLVSFKALKPFENIDQEHQSDTNVFTMTMEILLELTSNKLCGNPDGFNNWIKTSKDS
nr:hypothetical protein [Tanacetum cinerariifolium]